MERSEQKASGIPARVILAAAQRSGSTYLARILSRLSGFPVHHISDAYKGGEHELSVDLLKGLSAESFIAVVHTRCSMGTAQRIAEYELRTIITVRNIFDTIVSLHDRIRNADWNIPAFASPVMMTYCPARLRDAPDEEVDAFIVKFMVPWYFSFFASWQAYSRDIPVVRYEELIREPIPVVARALEGVNLHAEENDISGAVEKAQGDSTRLNVGIAGRGNLVEEKMGGQIREYANYFADVDFSPFFER